MNPARTFLRLFLAAAALLGGGIWLAQALIDPHNVSPLQWPMNRPMMDINQRFMFPQLARRKEYDSAIFGTSTVRLLNPTEMDPVFGTKFSNMAMNAATPWEQMQLAGLFMHHHPSARMIIFGLDTTWCETDADIKKLTFRPFPASFYDEDRYNDFSHFFSLKSVEISVRLGAYHAGTLPPRIRPDGYEVFVPREETYDLARAQFHIWGKNERIIRAVEPSFSYTPESAAAVSFPALAWLEDTLKKASKETRILLLIPPIHVASQPRPGSRIAALQSVCHQRIGALGRKYGASAINMQFSSPITRDDSNYWDPLHYRVAIATELVGILKAAIEPEATGGETYLRLDR